MSTALNEAVNSSLSVQSTLPATAEVGSEGEPSERERAAEAVAGRRETPDPEVVGRAVRRQFTTAYKQRILAEVNAAAGSGEVGRIIRREGLYSSHLAAWRKALVHPKRVPTPMNRGPKPVPKNPLQTENDQLKREKAQLLKKLKTAELMIDLQKKVSQLLGITLPVLDDDEVNS